MGPGIEGTNLLLSPFTTVTRVGGSLSLVWVDLGPGHVDIWRRLIRYGRYLEAYRFMSSLHQYKNAGRRELRAWHDYRRNGLSGVTEVAESQ